MPISNSDSDFQMNRDYYPQVFLEECRYIE